MNFIYSFIIFEAGAFSGFFVAALKRRPCWAGNHYQI